MIGGEDLVVDLSLLLVVIYLSMAGTALGSLTGLTPGVHVNTLALVLASLSPALLPVLGVVATLSGVEEETAPVLLVVVIVSAAVAHSFLDVLPSIFLGAPEEDTVLSTLPGHRMLLQGRGPEAVRCSAYGALVGGIAAICLCLPLTFLLGPPLGLMGAVDAATPLLLAIASVSLVFSEKGKAMDVRLVVHRASVVDGSVSLVRHVPVDRQEVTAVGRVEKGPSGLTWLLTYHGRWRLRGRAPEGTVRVQGMWRVRRTALRERALASLLMILSGMLGLTCMEGRVPLSDIWEGTGHTLLFPLLTGLFGMPTIISSLRGSTLPPQEEGRKVQDNLRSGILGALPGALVGWYPGISSTTGVIMASAFVRKGRGDDARRYLTMVSAVGTSSTVLGLLALALAFKGRSGAMMAAKEVLGADGSLLLTPPSPWFPLLLLAVLVSVAASYRLTLHLGRWFARLAGGVDLRSLNRAVLLLLVVMSVLFCGLPGMVVLAVATLLGLVPPRLAIGRVHLTGSLLLPTALHVLDLDTAFLPVL